MRVLDEINAKEAHVKSLTVMIETMRRERSELQYQIRMLVMKLPREVAQERHRQKVLAFKRGWWMKHKAEMDELKKEKKTLKKD